MGVGKYSPTVSNTYSKDQEWFEKNGGGFGNGLIPDSQYDNQGYDSYGYSGYTDRDRAGYTESDYLTDSIDDNQRGIYDRVRAIWDTYNAPTILDLTAMIQLKNENDKEFSFHYAKLMTVINIYEAASLARHQLDEVFKSSVGDQHDSVYEAEFKAFFTELSRNIQIHSEFLEEFYDKFLTDFGNLQKSFK